MIRTILAGAATLALAGCLLPEAQDQPAADAAYDEQLRAIVVGWFDECGANDYDAEGNRLANDCVERRRDGGCIAPPTAKQGADHAHRE